jgi:hypothetical protein
VDTNNIVKLPEHKMRKKMVWTPVGERSAEIGAASSHACREFRTIADASSFVAEIVEEHT